MAPEERQALRTSRPGKGRPPFGRRPGPGLARARFLTHRQRLLNLPSDRTFAAFEEIFQSGPALLPPKRPNDQAVIPLTLSSSFSLKARIRSGMYFPSRVLPIALATFIFQSHMFSAEM